MAQDLISKGFNYKVISVDRVNSDRVCEPYQYFKNTIYENRIKIPFDSEILTREVLDLERNNNTGRVDHPDSGRVGAKDCADAICGALWNASQHAEEFDFEYGDTLDAIIETDNQHIGNEK